MITHLENAFKTHYNIGREIKVEQMPLEKGTFEIKDSGENGLEVVESNGGFVVKLNTLAILINHEKFINSLQGIKAGDGKKCDGILYNGDSVIFVEL